MTFLYVLAGLNLIVDLFVGYLTIGIALVDKGLYLPLAKEFYDVVFEKD